MDGWRVDKGLRYTLWAGRKTTGVILRKHLSLFLAASLAFLTILEKLSEYLELFHTINEYLLRITPYSEIIVRSIFNGITSILIIGTLFALYWELKGNKLDVSEQEKRFAISMRDLLSRLETLRNTITATTTPEDCKRLFIEFIQRLLNAASFTLCGDSLIDAAYLAGKNHNLVLFEVSSKAKDTYPPINFPIPLSKIETERGPAAWAFMEKLLVHVPKLKIQNNLGFVLYEKSKNAEEDEIKDMPNTENYDISKYCENWHEAIPQDKQNFHSVLSIPVLDYKKENSFGVLCLTSNKRDFFITRDYTMGWCFANLIAQAKEITRQQ